MTPRREAHIAPSPYPLPVTGAREDKRKAGSRLKCGARDRNVTAPGRLPGAAPPARLAQR